MTHPEELLAGYVDGSLGPDERAEVDAHLATCGRCREEVALAASARSSLGELPRSVTVPGELGAPALEEATDARRPAADADGPGDASPGRPAAALDHPRWYRWAGAAAAAAAVVLAIAVIGPALTGIGNGGEQRAAGEAGAAGGGEEPPVLERLAADLTAEDLAALVEPVRGTLAGAPEADAGGEPVDGAIGGSASAVETNVIEAPAARLAAAECLRNALTEGIGGAAPLRLVSLRFEGVPAYAGVYPWTGAGGDGGGRLQVVVASRADCTILSAAVVEP